MAIEGKVTSLYSDKNKTEALFPRTKINAISDENNIGLDAILRAAAYGDAMDNGEAATVPADADSLAGRPASEYATKNYVATEIANAQLGSDGSSVDLTGFATKDDLTNISTELQQSINSIDYPVDSVNGKTGDVVLTAEDVGARPITWLPEAEDIGAVPGSRTINGKDLSSDIALSASDVGAFSVQQQSSDVDLNLIITDGVYDIDYSVETGLSQYHLPFDSGATRMNLIVCGNNSSDWSRITQIASFPFSHQKTTYIRYKHDLNWSEWQEIYTTGNKPTPAEIGALSNNGWTSHYATVLEAAMAMPKTGGTFFAIGGSTLINATDSAFPGNEITYLILTDETIGAARKTVIAFRYGDNQVKFRSIWDGSWFTDWDYLVSIEDINGVPATRTVNGKVLSDNITLSASDVNAVSKTGDTMSGSLFVQKDTADDANLGVKGPNGRIGLQVATNRGLWDFDNSAWVLKAGKDSTNWHLYGTADNVTGNVAIANGGTGAHTAPLALSILSEPHFNENWQAAEKGISVWHFEVDNTEENRAQYNIPHGGCEILVIKRAPSRGTAIAFGWISGDYHIWRNVLHDDTSSNKWGAWVDAKTAIGAIDNGRIDSNGDLNTVTTSGIYRIDAPSNCPSGCAYGQLIVAHGASDTIAQICFDYDACGMHVRSGVITNGAWSWQNWEKVYTTRYKPTPVDIGALPKVMTKGTHYGSTLPASGSVGEVFFKTGIEASDFGAANIEQALASRYPTDWGLASDRVTSDIIDFVDVQGIYYTEMNEWCQTIVFKSNWAVMQIQFNWNGKMRSRIKWGGQWTGWN